MFDWGRVGITFVEIWLGIIMPPRRKLSILDCGLALVWLNDGIRNCQMTELNLPLSKLPVNFVVCIFQRSVRAVSYTHLTLPTRRTV